MSPEAPQSDGVFDVPPQFANSHKDVVNEKVSAVSENWRWGMLDEKTLMLLVPQDQDPLAVSKEKFVSLLEYCEEDLDLERVVAVFEKTGARPEEGFPRTLRYIGFRLLSPDKLPENVDTQNFFAMQYLI